MLDLTTIRETGIILIIRTADADSAYDVAKAAIAGGIRALEIPFAVPGALHLVERLVRDFDDDGVVVGTGTVLDGNAAYASINAGARLLVSPSLNESMLEVANRYQVVSVGGAMTPTEIINTATLGADMVKVFPAEFLGPAYLKSVKVPLPQVSMVPTGGVDPTTVKDWFGAGASAVGVASYITKAGSADAITANSRELLDAIKQARS